MLPKINVAFFCERKDFVDYIQSNFNATPPEWAMGCFYGGGIQVLINLNDEKNIEKNKHHLLHETVHLYINHFIYDKYKINRIRWFDECFANYLDGTQKNIKNKELLECCKKLKLLKNFDLASLNDVKKIITNEYNGYDIFHIVGKYIFENNLQNDYIKIIKENYKKIQEIGKTILSDAINYIENKYKK